MWQFGVVASQLALRQQHRLCTMMKTSEFRADPTTLILVSTGDLSVPDDHGNIGALSLGTADFVLHSCLDIAICPSKTLRS